MTEKNKQKWNEILKYAVTVLTALLGALGVSAGGLQSDFMSRNPLILFNKLGRIQSGCALFLCRHISFSQHSTFNIQHSPSLYATCSSWYIDPCRFLFILSIVLNKISTFLFNTNDFQPFSPAIRQEYNQKRSLYKCNKAQPSHEDCASNSFLFCLIFKRVLTYIYL